MDYVPKTPKPRSIDDIQDGAKDRFAGLFISDMPKNLPIDKYFIEYDHFEKYDENKSYSKRPYTMVHNGIIREYTNYLSILDHPNGEQDYYVVSKKLYNELDSLEKYCPCLTCSASCFNPLKYIWCSYCTNCIKAGKGFTKEEYITQARANMEKNSHPQSLIQKYIQKNTMLKISEIFMIILIIVLLYSCFK
jgi:hypothetical protein